MRPHHLRAVKSTQDWGPHRAGRAGVASHGRYFRGVFANSEIFKIIIL